MPQPAHGLAVAGSATNLRRMVGPLLDEESLDARAAAAVAERPSSQIARQFELEPDRARILPAGALMLRGGDAATGHAAVGRPRRHPPGRSSSTLAASLR